jgi:hypothetical protein
MRYDPGLSWAVHSATLCAGGSPAAQRMNQKKLAGVKPEVTTKTKTAADYLGAFSNDKQTALERLRNAIRAAAPRAEECISYRLPAFRLGDAGSRRR